MAYRFDGKRRLVFPQSVDMRAVRKRCGASQTAFAVGIGVPLATVRKWERLDRPVSHAVFVLMAMLERDPAIVMRTLRKPRRRRSSDQPSA